MRFSRTSFFTPEKLWNDLSKHLVEENFLINEESVFLIVDLIYGIDTQLDLYERHTNRLEWTVRSGEGFSRRVFE